MPTSQTNALGLVGEERMALLISPAEPDHETFQNLFHHHGWSLDAVTCVRSATKRVRESPVSLVITERDLPDGDWKDVLETVHDLPDPPLVVIISALADNYLWSEALNLGAYDVLSKPLNQTEVFRVLSSAWIHHAHVSETRSTHPKP
jgi:DNA-binding NtrC family response regulator